MNLRVSSPKKKLLIIGISVVVLAAAAGSAATYFALRDNLIRNYDTAGQAQTGNAATQPLTEEKLPEGTISPTTIARDYDQYNGKELKVRGRIIEISEGKYMIVGQEQKEPAAVNLDISKANTDISQYISGYSDISRYNAGNDPNKPEIKTAGAVTVTGTIGLDGRNVKLTASKIEF